MTVIAYKNGILACDSRIHTNYLIAGHTKKGFKSPDGWVGAGSGKATEVSELVQWGSKTKIGKKIEPELLPSGSDFTAILVSPQRTVYYVSDSFFTELIPEDYHAEGEGASIALGAMHAGATAVQAVSAAIAHSAACGGPVQVYELD